MKKFNNWLATGFVAVCAMFMAVSANAQDLPSIKLVVDANNVVFLNNEGTTTININLDNNVDCNGVQFDIKVDGLAIKSFEFNKARIDDSFMTSWSATSGRVIIIPESNETPIPALEEGEDATIVTLVVEQTKVVTDLDLTNIKLAGDTWGDGVYEPYPQKDLKANVYSIITLESAADVVLHADEVSTLAVGMTNPLIAFGFSFDITLPENVELVKAAVSDRVINSVVRTNLNDNSYRVTVYSATGEEAIAVGSGDIINLGLQIAEDAEVENGPLGNIVINNFVASVGEPQNARDNISYNDLVIPASYDATTGINTVINNQVSAKYYNVNGVEVANPEAGKVYIKVAGDKAVKVLNK